MAVEARHVDLFPSQLITHSHRGDFIKSNQGNVDLCHTQMDSFTPFAESVLPLYQNLEDKADSGLTYNIIPAPRKRSRDSIYCFDGYSQRKNLSTLVDEDVILLLQQQQSEIDCYIAQHAEKVRLEVEEKRKRQWRMLVSAVQQGMAKKLKEKEEEMERMGKLNWVLQERVKSLYVENQVWREMAQTNEATANCLRSNLEQVLAQERQARCGSSSSSSSSDYEYECRKCGERESSVLVLPCRHLCLCAVCGSTIHASCPVCHSIMDATLHINLS